jgi:ABC-type phosphate/phosphonate transport system substrate-binding protein/outer membrane protein assembly factor BamB
MRCRKICLLIAVVLSFFASRSDMARGQQDVAAGTPAQLSILVADPLAKGMACECVAGFAQRRYDALALALEKRLHCPVKTFQGAKLSAYWSDDQKVSLIVGKYSDVLFQAREMGRPVYPIAAMTDSQGLTTLQGLFVVRAGNAARTLSDLQGYRVVFGPKSCDEKHRAAIDALQAAGVQLPDAAAQETVPGCTDAANELMKLTDADKAVAVISDYAKTLLEGCHSVPKDSLRVIGRTEPVPFVTVFATDEVAPELRSAVQQELLAANRFPTLLRLLESKNGFQTVAEDNRRDASQSWTDFRGPHRAALVPALPASLDGMRTLWTAPLEGRGLGGMAVTSRWVVVTDRLEEARRDYLKLLDIHTGKLRFTGELVEPTGNLNAKNLDYGNSVRTTPLVQNGTVYLLDALGALYRWPLPVSDVFAPTACITGKSTGMLVDDFELVKWGVSSTPLLAGNANGEPRLICNICSASHTLLALDPGSFAVQWTGAGRSTGYASCIAGRWGGRQQVIGYDSCSLGGWDLETGQRIWSVSPAVEGDYNVPTPVAIDDQRILVISESNGTRVYAFDEHGVLRQDPVAVNLDVVNDTVTPVFVAGKVYCTSKGTLCQLDVEQGLRKCWTMADDVFSEHVCLLADTQGLRLLVTTFGGELLLFNIEGPEPRLIGRCAAFAAGEREEIYSHPSLVGNRLYLRGLRSVRCLQF